MQPRRILALAFLLLATALGPARAATPPAPFLLDEALRCDETAPDVAFLPGGGFVAVWAGSRPQALLASSAVYLRLFDRDGRPLGSETMLTGATEQPGRPTVATDADGRIMAVWGDHGGEGAVRGRLFGPSGAPLSEVLEISERFPRGGVDVTAETGGGFAVVFADEGSIVLRRYTAAGEARGPEQVILAFGGVPEDPFPRGYDPAVVADGPTGLAVTFSDSAPRTWTDPTLRGGNLSLMRVEPGQEPPYTYIGAFELDPVAARQRLPRPSLAVGAAGRVLVAWREQTAAGTVSLRGQIYTALGEPLAPAFRIDLGEWDELSGPSVAADNAGNFLVAWLGAQAIPQLPGAQAYLRRFGPDGSPLGRPESLSEPFARFEPDTSPSLAVDAWDRVLVAWGEGRQGPPEAPPECFSHGLFARLLASFVPLELPLQGGRFLAGVRWTDHAGRTGVGQPVALTGDSGYFWFFGENNAELVVKVLDGRAVNGHFWVFYGALSDVAYTLEVRDALTGVVKTYTNPAGRLTSRADTSAFAVPAATAAKGAVGAVTAPPLSAPTELEFLASSGMSGISGPGPGKSFSKGLFCGDTVTVPLTGFCLGGRFEVTAEWRANGITGTAGGAGLGADSGYFWFFGHNNVELLVKVLDGRAVNGRFWFFSGALTDVEHWIHVYDSETGEERVYHNPPGQLASRADTSAFPLLE